MDLDYNSLLLIVKDLQWFHKFYTILMDLKALLGRVEREPRCDNHSIHLLSMHACLCLSFSLSPRLRHKRDWKSRPCTPFNRAAIEQSTENWFLHCSNLILLWFEFLCSGWKWTRLPEQNNSMSIILAKKYCVSIV